MKLLFCDECGSVFSLAINRIKRCDCGRVAGKYVNNRFAVTNGKGVAIGMGTGSLRDAMISKRRMERDNSNGYSRKRYQESCSVITWCRPHEGIANPHTKVSEDYNFEDLNEKNI